MKKVAIIDYGSGNLRSAAKAFESAARETGHEVAVTSSHSDLSSASHIVLPGVGAFADCMKGLAAVPGMIEAMSREALESKKPFLGICVGMQLLADWGHEHGKHKGLGWIKGEVTLISAPGLKVPHMGWNNVSSGRSPLFKGIAPETDFYFVHSYKFDSADKNDVLATVGYGEVFPAAIGKGNIMGVQFHPEKSQRAGLELIRNFLEL